MITLKSNSPNKIENLNSDFVRDFYPDDLSKGNKVLWSSNKITQYLQENKEVFQINYMVFNLHNNSLPTLNISDYIIVVNGGNNFSTIVKDQNNNFITVQNNQILKYVGTNEFIQIYNPLVEKIQTIFHVLNIKTSTYAGSSEFNLLKPSYYQFYQNSWFDIINGYLDKTKLIDKFSLGPFNMYNLVVESNNTQLINSISYQNFNIKETIKNHFKQFSLNITYSCNDSFSIRLYDNQNINNTYFIGQGNNMIFETPFIINQFNNIIENFSNLNIEISTNTSKVTIHNLELMYYNII